VEFRNERWITEETLDLLRRLKMAFCCVDEPRLKGLVRPHVFLTAEIGYVRFHGRNYETWWDHKRKAWERYDYLYDEEELREWVPRIMELEEKAERTYVIFNNHYRGKAARNAAMMARLLPAGDVAPLHMEGRTGRLWDEGLK